MGENDARGVVLLMQADTFFSADPPPGEEWLKLVVDPRSSQFFIWERVPF